MNAVHPDAPDERVVRDIRKNAREVARIQLRTFKGARLIDIRAHAQQPDGSTVPTPKGIALGVNSLREMIDALTEAERCARQMGWLAADSPQRKTA